MLLAPSLAAAGSDAVGFLAEEISALAFRAHPYGQPIPGWPEDVGRIPRGPDPPPVLAVEPPLAAVGAVSVGLDYADRYRREVARVTAAAVRRVSARVLVPDGFSRVVVGQLP